MGSVGIEDSGSGTAIIGAGSEGSDEVSSSIDSCDIEGGGNGHLQ